MEEEEEEEEKEEGEEEEEEEECVCMGQRISSTFIKKSAFGHLYSPVSRDDSRFCNPAYQIVRSIKSRFFSAMKGKIVSKKLHNIVFRHVFRPS